MNYHAIFKPTPPKWHTVNVPEIRIIRGLFLHGSSSEFTQWFRRHKQHSNVLIRFHEFIAICQVYLNSF